MTLAKLRSIVGRENILDSLPRSEVALMLEKIDSIASNHRLTFGNFGHAGDGNLHPTCLTDERDADEIRRAEKAIEEIATEAVRMGGTITGEHGVGLAKRQLLERLVGEPAIDMMRRIKRSMDPNGVLNPGKIFTFRLRCEGPLPTNREQIQKFAERGAFT